MAMEQKAEVPVPGQAAPATSKDPLAEHKAKFAELLEKSKREPDLNAPVKKAAKESDSAPESVPAPEPDEKPKRSPEVEKLRNKLLLAGNPKRAVESLDDDDVVEWWKKQEERERTAALALQRASELEKLASEKATSKPEPQGVPTDELDLDEVESELADQFGEDEAKVLSRALRQLVEPLRKQQHDLAAVIDAARKEGEKQISKTNRERLAEKLPMLKENDRAWEVITAQAREAITKDPQKFTSAAEAFDDAFQALYGDVAAKEPTASQKDDAKVKARISESGVTAPNTQKRAKAFTPIDAHRAAFEHLLKNADDVEGARKTYGRFQVQ